MITTLLTGAGAVLDWNAPTTNELTNMLKIDETFKTKDGTPVGNCLFDLLQEKNNYDINFEHIINLVESIYNYIDKRESKIQLSNSVFTKLDDTFENKLFDFENIYIKKENGYFYPTEDDVVNCFSTRAGYLKRIYDHYIKLIAEKISEYEQNIENFEELNKSFKNFLIACKNPWLRFYTTNYDRLPLLSTRLKFFEGFSTDRVKKPELDSLKINNLRLRNCYYNLHGSIHFNHEGKRIFNETDSKFTMPEVYQEQISQTGEILLRSSILTGMNKSSRILFSPHQQYYNAFYNDCFRSDFLIIVGYSFSDIHINQAIKEVIKEKNGNLKILIIDYWKTEDQFVKLWEKMSKLGLGFYRWDFCPEKLIKAPTASHFLFGNGFKSLLSRKDIIDIFLPNKWKQKAKINH